MNLGNQQRFGSASSRSLCGCRQGILQETIVRNKENHIGCQECDNVKLTDDPPPSVRFQPTLKLHSMQIADTDDLLILQVLKDIFVNDSLEQGRKQATHRAKFDIAGC